MALGKGGRMRVSEEKREKLEYWGERDGGQGKKDKKVSLITACQLTIRGI